MIIRELDIIQRNSGARTVSGFLLSQGINKIKVMVIQNQTGNLFMVLWGGEVYFIKYILTNMWEDWEKGPTHGTKETRRPGQETNQVDYGYFQLCLLK